MLVLTAIAVERRSKSTVQDASELSHVGDGFVGTLVYCGGDQSCPDAVGCNHDI